jgi:hypothetical protein
MAIGRISMSVLVAVVAGCGLAHFGHDDAPKGCSKSAIVSSRYDTSSATIFLTLMNGIEYQSEADRDISYDGWPDHHVGPFQRGEAVIVCRDGAKAFDIRNDIIGEGVERFHVAK